MQPSMADMILRKMRFKFVQMNVILHWKELVGVINLVDLKKSIYVKPVYKGHSREPENVAFLSSCLLYTG
jgi:hypothetical protein